MIVLKLDFRKAFDSVSWDALNQIMEARGFGNRWIHWINILLSSSSSSVLINGQIGDKIKLQSGLRQGDALSPYLFILMVDVLQQMRISEYNRGTLQHPLNIDGPFPVLQYADDTLLLIKGMQEQAQVVRRILDAFCAFTGLHINFNKSTFVPVGMDETTSNGVAVILQCPISSFPWTYLGLPLSTQKISHGMLLPVIHRVDRRLSGWLATFLSWGGRLTLVNSVLASIPNYFMACFIWPQQSLDRLEQILQGFL